MKPNLEEIELALKDRQWLTLDASVLLAWLIYTRELEGKAKEPEQIIPSVFTLNPWSVK